MLKPILTGEYSHFLPVILCLAFVGITILLDLSLTVQIAGCLVITLIWYTARFGHGETTFDTQLTMENSIKRKACASQR